MHRTTCRYNKLFSSLKEGCLHTISCVCVWLPRNFPAFGTKCTFTFAYILYKAELPSLSHDEICYIDDRNQLLIWKSPLSYGEHPCLNSPFILRINDDGCVWVKPSPSMGYYVNNHAWFRNFSFILRILILEIFTKQNIWSFTRIFLAFLKGPPIWNLIFSLEWMNQSNSLKFSYIFIFLWLFYKSVTNFSRIKLGRVVKFQIQVT